ncbi:non-hydrolyzing UDP-N-acetylglucosamine 2-epimerase [Halosegnis marinus]|uniref:Non-hydrolyzing UDP-N-acetylglucosamine 2-epimerase n=1 Tax=Halosegnis marinus TaxID=3034023 RepID=A0ABD5ZR71_9EURY|nr:UDP-N-acetylglucosamine 2-epimerase (non-hydrolyzing) [Halosegnis sp. DT85]
MKVLSVVGTRPHFVKAAPVSRALDGACEHVLVHTGQHYDDALSERFFRELDIPRPDHDLRVGSADHGPQTAMMLSSLSAVLRAESPDVVLVYGDTNSTLAGALATAKLPPTLAHVEAGVRCFNRDIPEEVNRVLTDHASDLLFAPTETAVDNLAAEGVTAGVTNTGDVLYDALLWARDRLDAGVLDEFGVVPGEYVLSTVHRAHNTDDPERLGAILRAFGSLALPVVLPAHPRTREAVAAHGLDVPANVKLVEPVSYLDFLALLDGAARVATDSGGVRKEAFYLDTPCVTLREETVWPETVAAGWNELVGTDEGAIVRALTREWDLGEKPAPYGEGDAALAIREAILGVE